MKTRLPHPHPLVGNPFSDLDIDAAARAQRAELEASILAARLEAMRTNVADLFLVLAQAAPELLPEAWQPVHESLVGNERYWVCPQATVGDVEEGNPEARVPPFINRPRVIREWDSLVAQAYERSRSTSAGCGPS